jgi:hypothetical protein
LLAELSECPLRKFVYSSNQHFKKLLNRKEHKETAKEPQRELAANYNFAALCEKTLRTFAVKLFVSRLIGVPS